MRFEELELGQTATLSREVTDSEVRRFAEVSTDFNPVHLDDAAAAQSRFGRRIAHGMLSAAWISAALGTVLPGPGVIYLSQTLRFLKPVFLGDTITVQLKVLELIGSKRARIQTNCLNQDSVVVLEGEALVYVPD